MLSLCQPRLSLPWRCVRCNRRGRGGGGVGASVAPRTRRRRRWGRPPRQGCPGTWVRKRPSILARWPASTFVPNLPGFLAPSLRLSGLVAATVVLLLLVPPPTAAEHAPIFYIPPALNHLFHVNIPTKNQFGKSITVHLFCLSARRAHNRGRPPRLPDRPQPRPPRGGGRPRAEGGGGPLRAVRAPARGRVHLQPEQGGRRPVHPGADRVRL